MEITASMVKELRERSGVGMMECKKALTENSGNIDSAMEWLRKQGLAKADKKAGRIAAEGRISMAAAAGKAVMVEINSETDFVAKDENFVRFCELVAQTALNSDAADIEALKGAAAEGGSIEELRSALVLKLGENIQLRRIVALKSESNIGAYVHGGRIGVLVDLKGGNAELARGIAMHVAAMNPPYISPAHVPAEIALKEKEIALAQMSDKDKAKPAEIQEKMISGKINKTLSEMTLTRPVLRHRHQHDSGRGAQGRQGRSRRLPPHRGRRGHREGGTEDYAAEVMKQAGLA